MDKQNLNNYIKSVINISFLTKKYINDGNFTKAIKNIIFLPMGFNKVRLMLRILLPKSVVKKVQYYQ